MGYLKSLRKQRRGVSVQVAKGSVKSRRAIPRVVWVLGFVSLLMDISSEMIHAILPLFMSVSLGAGAVWIGLVEGIGEGGALLSKVFSGLIADRFGHKKWLVF